MLLAIASAAIAPVAMAPAFAAGGASSANPGMVVGNVYESAHLIGFGLSQPSPCGTFAFDPCPPVRHVKHPRPR
jgi:hypothetical protein